MPDGFTPTWMRWYNTAEGGKIASADIGPYRDIPYGAIRNGEKSATGKPPHPRFGQWQWGIACSAASRTIGIDIDHADRWADSHTADVLGENWAALATSYRQTPDGEIRAHIMIEVPEELTGWWPRQGQTSWGDIKSNGFTYVEGTHHTGTAYVPTGRPWLVATEELMRALVAEPRTQHGGSPGRTGAIAGSWDDDDYEITGDNQLTADIMSMVAAGLSTEQIHDRLDIILKPVTTPWTPREIETKISSAQRKIADREQAEEDFAAGFFQAHGVTITAVLEDRARPRAPQEIATEAQTVNQHQLVAGITETRSWADRLNPMRRPYEPLSYTDKALATDTLMMAFPSARYAADDGGWISYEGIAWKPWGTKADAAGYASALATAAGEYLKSERTLNDELSAQGTAKTEEEIAADDARVKRLVEARKRFTSAGALGSIGKMILNVARSTDVYSVNIGELDSEPDVLWAGGAPWSLRHPVLTFANEVRSVNPVHMKSAATYPIQWHEGMTPAFDQVLAAVWPDPEVRRWALREIAGVMLWGDTSKMHPVLDGAPGGGKSTFALILTRVLGSYAVQVSPDKILGGDTSAAAEEEIAALIGARMAWMDEPPPSGKQAISRFNDLASGTGTISAAKKYANRVTAPKLFNFLICQNPRNALRLDAQGVGERVTYIPCDGIPQVTRLAWSVWVQEGAAEYPAVLGRLIEECARFRNHERYPVPLAVSTGRASAQERADEFGTWLSEHYDTLPADTLSTDPRLSNSPTIGTLRTQYNDGYARANALPRVGAAEVKDQLDRLDIRIATAGVGNSRKRFVVFVTAKPIAMGVLR